MWVYWLTLYLYDIVLYLLVAAIVAVLSIAFGFAVATQGRYGLWFLK